jgi:hypothetical protein
MCEMRSGLAFMLAEGSCQLNWSDFVNWLRSFDKKNYEIRIECDNSGAFGLVFLYRRSFEPKLGLWAINDLNPRETFVNSVM